MRAARKDQEQAIRTEKSHEWRSCGSRRGRIRGRKRGRRR